MPSWQSSPLFRAASRAVQDAARAQFQGSTLGQLIAAAERGASRPLPFSRMKLPGRQRAIKMLLGSGFGTMAATIERYSKAGGGRWSLMRTLLGELGPVGKLLAAMGTGRSAGKTPMEREAQAAVDLLRSLGYEVLPPGKKNATVADVNRGIEAASQFLKERGYQVTAPTKPGQTPGSGRNLPFNVSPTTKTGKPRKTVELPFPSGNRKFPVDHPIVTRKMIPTPQSSNVYAFGYDIEAQALFVRYKAQGRNGKVNKPGSLYRYDSVPPQVFLAFVKAPSKGTFVWDNIRVRGTVSGHQYDYALVGIRNGYVPRKAVLRKAGEFYEPRTFRDPRTGKYHKSQMGRQQVSTINRGSPNRGEPNRGKG